MVSLEQFICMVPFNYFFMSTHLKGVLNQIFDFFTDQFPPGAWVPIGAIEIFMKIWGDIRNFVFIAGVNNTGVNGTGDCRCLPPVMKPCSEFSVNNDTGDN